MDSKIILGNFLGGSRFDDICSVDQFFKECSNDFPDDLKYGLFDALRRQRLECIDTVKGAIQEGLEPSKDEIIKFTSDLDSFHYSSYSISSLLESLDQITQIFLVQQQKLKEDIDLEIAKLEQRSEILSFLLESSKDLEICDLDANSDSLKKCVKLTSV